MLVRILFCLVLSVVASAAQAHSWYPEQCCRGDDCTVLPGSAVRPSPEGWMLSTTGETIPFDDSRVLISPDGRFHQCIFPTEKHTTQCLFVPAAQM